MRCKCRGLGWAHKKELRSSVCIPLGPRPLWNTDEMLEVKRPPCDSERVNMRTEAHGTDDLGSCPHPDSLLHKNTREKENSELVKLNVQFRASESAPKR